MTDCLLQSLSFHKAPSLRHLTTEDFCVVGGMALHRHQKGRTRLAQGLQSSIHSSLATPTFNLDVWRKYLWIQGKSTSGPEPAATLASEALVEGTIWPTVVSSISFDL